MKKQSKYDEMFDPLREVLIEYATMKDDKGRLLHKAKEIMWKFGFGTDPAVVDGFNRWLNRQGVYRIPKPKRNPIKVEAQCVDDLSPALKSLEGKAAELFPDTNDAGSQKEWKYPQVTMNKARLLIDDAYRKLIQAAELLVKVAPLLLFKEILDEQIAQEGDEQ